MSDMDHDWEFNGQWTHDPEAERDQEHAYQCACGDPTCIGDDRDKDNIRIGHGWYASDCALANAHPEVVRSRELDRIWEERRGR